MAHRLQTRMAGGHQRKPRTRSPGLGGAISIRRLHRLSRGFRGSFPQTTSPGLGALPSRRRGRGGNGVFLRGARPDGVWRCGGKSAGKRIGTPAGQVLPEPRTTASVLEIPARVWARSHVPWRARDGSGIRTHPGTAPILPIAPLSPNRYQKPNASRLRPKPGQIGVEPCRNRFWSPPG